MDNTINKTILKKYTTYISSINDYNELYDKYNSVKEDYLQDKDINDLMKLKIIKKHIEEFTMNHNVDDKLRKIEERNQKNNYMPYPQLDNPNFINDISRKKEFYYNRNEFDINSNQCKNDFELGNHQIFLKNFMYDKTPYKGLLLYHGVGTGKTCSAVTIAENFRDIYGRSGKKNDINKRIIILVPNKNVESGWRRNIFDKNKDIDQCTGDTFANELSSTLNTNTGDISNRINKVINKYYEFHGYREFANDVTKQVRSKLSNKDISKLTSEERNIYNKQVKEQRKKIIGELFSNRILIVDEIHNLRSDKEEDKDSNKDSLNALNEIVQNASNLRLVFLSATPMYDNVTEIIWLLNLLLLNDNKEQINKSEIFDRDNNITENGKKLLLNKSRGYISYLRGENPASFPIRLFPYDNKDKLCYNPKDSSNCALKYPENDTFGNKITPDNKILFSTLYLNKYEGVQKDTNLRYISRLEGNSKIQLTDENELKSLSNIVFPNESFKNTFSKNGKKYSYNTDIDFLELGKLKQYSIKFHNIILNIMNSEGIVFIFMERIERGCIPLGLALERLGFSKYNDNNLFNGKTDNNLYIDENGKVVKSKTSNKANYIIISGDKSISPNNIKEINVLRGDNNVNGEQIKVVIGSPTVSEGLDFKRVREVHIVDPWYNLSKIEQIIGRGIRFCSHNDLPKHKRNVTVFLHVGYLDSHETVDYYIYKEAEKKAQQTGIVEKILKENSIDCFINKDMNFIDKNDVIRVKQITSQNNIVYKKPYDKPNTKICSFLDDCNIKCSTNNVDVNNIDNSTINYNLLRDLMNKIIKFIKELYFTSNNVAFKLEDIYTIIKQYYGNKYDKNIINKSITMMINNKINVVNNENIEGYLIYKNNYLCFQPYNNVKHLPIYDRKTVNRTMKKKYSINDYNKSIKTTKKELYIDDIDIEGIMNININGIINNKLLNDKQIEYENEIIDVINKISRNIKINTPDGIKEYSNYLIDYIAYTLPLNLKTSLLLKLIKNFDNTNHSQLVRHFYSIFRRQFIYKKDNKYMMLHNDIDDKPIGFFYKNSTSENIMKEFSFDYFKENFTFISYESGKEDYLKKDIVLSLYEYINQNSKLIDNLSITKYDIYGYTVRKDNTYYLKIYDDAKKHTSKRTPGKIVLEGNVSKNKSNEILQKFGVKFDGKVTKEQYDILLTILCMKNKKYLNNDLYSFNINLNYLKI